VLLLNYNKIEPYAIKRTLFNAECHQPILQSGAFSMQICWISWDFDAGC